MSWDIPTDRSPIDFADDFRAGRGVAEIAWVEENGQGTGLEQTWELRDVRFDNLQVADFEWGRIEEPIRMTLVLEQPKDRGTIHRPGAALTSDRFPDVADTSERGRARLSDSALPPIPIGPSAADYSMLSPMLVVADEDNALTGFTDLVPRRFMMVGLGEALYDTTTDRDVQIVDPLRNDKARYDSAVYTGVPVVGTDALGDSYTYIPGLFRETFDSSVTTNTANPDVTGFNFLRVQEGDQFRVTADGEDDWLRIDTITDGGAMRLVANSTSTRASVAAYVLRVPAEVQASAYAYVTQGGGIVGPWGYGPMSNPMEVLEWLLSKSVMDTEIDYGSIRALAGRFGSWSIGHVVIEEGAKGTSPYDYAVSRLLSWLPVRPYLYRGQYRFHWDGPVDESEIVTTADLDDDFHGLVREGLLQDMEQPVCNQVTCSFGFDYRRRTYTKHLTITGTSSAQTSRVRGNARALQSQTWFEPKPGRRHPVILNQELTTDCIIDDLTMGLAANALIYRYFMRPAVMMVRGPSVWAGRCELGDVIRLTQNDSTYADQMWRVRVKTRQSNGGVRMALEEVFS